MKLTNALISLVTIRGAYGVWKVVKVWKGTLIVIFDEVWKGTLVVVFVKVWKERIRSMWAMCSRLEFIDFIDITCDAKACTPFCSLLEPVCEPCDKGGLFGATCPQESTNCEISFNVDAEPTCVSSDCVIPVDIQCGPCKEAVPIGCPDVEGFCELDFQTLECVTCTDEACPNLPLDQCSQPAGGDARRLGVGNEKWGSKFELGLGLGL
eukprot:scaffold1202_cov149-Skeletonema_menzelii.AAC.6